MTSQLAKQISKELYNLYDRRVGWILRPLEKRKGPPKTFAKSKVDESISLIQDLNQEALQNSPSLRREFKELQTAKRQWHPKRGKGHGLKNKAKAFTDWYRDNFPYTNIVYAFWSETTCLYIGRTKNGKNRPTNHFEKHWFSGVTRIDLFGFTGKKDLPKFECLATHYYDPRHAKKRPATSSYASYCPICRQREWIRSDIKYIFRLR